MRKSSKILAILFLIVAAALFFLSNRLNEGEVLAEVEARMPEEVRLRSEALADREAAFEQEMIARAAMMEDTLAARAAALDARSAAFRDSLVQSEQALRARLDTLESIHARGEVLYRIHADTVAQVLRRMGLAYERTTDAQGDPKFTFRLATHPVTMFFHTCEESACKSIRLWAGFRLNTPPEVSLINEWNRTKRFATAYRNSEDVAALDADLVFEGGATVGALEAFILQFRNSVTNYARHIDF